MRVVVGEGEFLITMISKMKKMNGDVARPIGFRRRNATSYLLSKRMLTDRRFASVALANKPVHGKWHDHSSFRRRPNLQSFRASLSEGGTLVRIRPVPSNQKYLHAW
jgi:hypothetical protein